MYTAGVKQEMWANVWDSTLS